MNSIAFASFGPGQLRPGRETDEIDGMIPSAVLTPRSVDQVAAAVGEAKRQKLGLIVTGGETSIDTGNTPSAYDIRVSMTAIADTIDQKPEDMTVNVAAGVTMARLTRALARNGQRVAVDPASVDDATIGGLIASNLTGGLRYGFGTWRDLVLGLSVIDGCGRRYECGSQVVKNVAGFDLPRLFVGSWGSLGIITSAILRTHPIPEQELTLIFVFEDSEELDEVRAKIFDAPLPLAAFDFAGDIEGGALGGGRSVWTLAIHIEGTEEQIAHQAAALEALTGRAPVETDPEWWSPVHAPLDAGMVLRIGTKPSLILDAVEQIMSAAGGRVPSLCVGGHLGDGIARIVAMPSSRAQSESLAVAVRNAARATGAYVVVERTPSALKTGADIWGADDTGLILMRELKHRFDPDNIMAPGRFVGGL